MLPGCPVVPLVTIAPVWVTNGLLVMRVPVYATPTIHPVAWLLGEQVNVCVAPVVGPLPLPQAYAVVRYPLELLPVVDITVYVLP